MGFAILYGLSSAIHGDSAEPDNTAFPPELLGEAVAIFLNGLSKIKWGIAMLDFRLDEEQPDADRCHCPLCKKQQICAKCSAMREELGEIR